MRRLTPRPARFDFVDETVDGRVAQPRVGTDARDLVADVRLEIVERPESGRAGRPELAGQALTQGLVVEPQ